MKKSVVKKILVVLLLISLIFLISCQGEVAGGEKPIDTAAAARIVQTGVEGVVTRVMPNYPPNTMYDHNELISLVEVYNRGNFDLEPQDCFIQVTGFDPNIITGAFNVPRSCAEGYGVLEGKNLYNTEGSFNQLEFRSSSVMLPEGVFEYNPTLNFKTCYHYHTRANPQICVDPLFYQVTSEQKTCIPRDVSTGGGQGGPVGVSYVGVDMVGSKAIFEINVVSHGSGRVLSPYADIRTCGQGTLDRTDLDRVAYSVQLSGGSLVDCKPRDGFVRLNNGQGKVICSFNIPGTSAYETPLLIDLDYSYIQSTQKSLKIIKTPE